MIINEINIDRILDDSQVDTHLVTCFTNPVIFLITNPIVLDEQTDVWQHGHGTGHLGIFGIHRRRIVSHFATRVSKFAYRAIDLFAFGRGWLWGNHSFHLFSTSVAKTSTTNKLIPATCAKHLQSKLHLSKLIYNDNTIYI